MKKSVIISGAGASGMMAAITAAREGAQVTILEQQKKPGKKLLMTGNGKCNLTNKDLTNEKALTAYSSSDPEALRSFLQNVKTAFSAEDTIRFFEEIGLLMTEKDGWYYPYSLHSSSVLKVLENELQRLKVRIRCETRVEKIRYSKEDKKWKADVPGWTYDADALILSCGTCAGIADKKYHAGYDLAGSAGHTVNKLLPGLTGLTTREKFPEVETGVRTRARVSWEEFGETGELQWSRNGISGIAVFQLSRLAVRALEKKKELEFMVDLFPEISFETLRGRIHKACMHDPDLTVLCMLEGFLPPRICPVILRMSRIPSSRSLGQMTDASVEMLTAGMKQLSLHVNGSRKMDQAQIAVGGISLREIDPVTMESKIMPGLFFSGEMIDIDGPCGGYNLQWAWSSGYLAGKNAAAGSIK